MYLVCKENSCFLWENHLIESLFSSWSHSVGYLTSLGKEKKKKKKKEKRKRKRENKSLPPIKNKNTAKQKSGFSIKQGNRE